MRTLLLLPLVAALGSAQLQITTSGVPGATQNQGYVALLSAAGGTKPYTWSVVSSTGTSLPEGMSLDPASGIVSAQLVYGQGGYAVTIEVTDSSSPSPATATKTLNFGVHSDDSYGGCRMFPPDSIYNQRVDQLPVDTNPSHQIPSGYLNSPLHPDFGQGFYPAPGGIPFMRVPANLPPANVSIASDGQLDVAGTYAWPFPPWPNAAIEMTSYGASDLDHHILLLQTSANDINGPQTGPCVLYETYNDIAVKDMFDAGTNTWYFSAGVHYVLNSNDLAASPDALDNGAQDSAGVPMMPLLMRYSEVPLKVAHPLRIAFPSPTNWFAWPATGCCSGTGPPQGLLYRLKASVNWQSTCPVAANPQAATVLQALQQYGAYMSDHGGTGFVGGVPDDRWDDDDLACIKRFHVRDLEVVDNSPLEVLATSGQTRPYVVPVLLAAGTVNVSYSATFSAAGGHPDSRQWVVTSGSLPPGVLLNSSTGIVSGTIASSAGSPFHFSVTATDTISGLASLPQPFSIAVDGSGPSLTPAVSHTGNFTQGQTGAQYTITVSNAVGAEVTSGAVTIVESLPAGLTLVSMSGGAMWNCTALPSCTTSVALNGGASYPPITVLVNVAVSAGATVLNQASVTGGATGVDSTSIFTPCDINQDGSTNSTDVQQLVKEALGIVTPVHHLNGDGGIGVLDIQILTNAALNVGCMAK